MHIRTNKVKCNFIQRLGEVKYTIQTTEWIFNEVSVNYYGNEFIEKGFYLVL